MGIVYKIQSRTSNKVYIGITKGTLEKRFKRHVRNALKEDSHYKFHRALRKYGADDFVVSVVEECDDSLLIEREKFYIEKYDSYRNGYNSTIGGDGFGSRPGNKLSEETKEKLRKAALLQFSKDGVREELSKARKGMVVAKDLHTGEIKRIPKEEFYSSDRYVGATHGYSQSSESNTKRSKKLKGRKMTKEQVEKIKKGRAANFNVYNHADELVFSGLSAKEVQNICRSLYGKTIDNRLGATTASKQQLNKQGKLNLVGWYTEKGSKDEKNT